MAASGDFDLIVLDLMLPGRGGIEVLLAMRKRADDYLVKANLETRKALEQADPNLRPAKPPRWKHDADLLAWLDSL